MYIMIDQELIGRLKQDDGGQMTVQYDQDWRAKLEPIPLSRSLPLREELVTQKECRGFFGGTLAEKGNRKVIARILGISDKNDFAMLEQIGGECAGSNVILHAIATWIRRRKRHVRTRPNRRDNVIRGNDCDESPGHVSRAWDHQSLPVSAVFHPTPSAVRHDNFEWVCACGCRPFAV